MRIHTALLVSIILLAGCNNQTSNKTEVVETPAPKSIDRLTWLLGAWGSVSIDEQTAEVWAKKDDSTFVGYGYTIFKGDTVAEEYIMLRQSGNDLYYIPRVKNQNGNKPVIFKYNAGAGEEGYIFENPQHDFPQRIIYKHVGADSLNARIEGTQKGKFEKFEFGMKRLRLVK